MTRKTAIALLRAAGYENDDAEFTRVYFRARIGMPAAQKAFAEGRRLRAEADGRFTHAWQRDGYACRPA